MTAELIFVGTELLMGQTLNTNGQYIGRMLQSLGVSCYYQTTLGDNLKRLTGAFTQALSRSDVVITTGGLGPTVDDITKEAAANALGKTLEPNPKALAMVQKRFKALGRTMTENNLRQGCFTKETVILTNNHGTAPGAMVPVGEGKWIIHLPGPPHEMVPMFEQHVVPFFQKAQNQVFESRYIRIIGMGESEVDFRLGDLEQGANPSLSPYTSPGEVVLRAMAFAKNRQEALTLLTPLIGQVKEKLGKAIYRIDEDDKGSLEEWVIATATRQGKTIAVAESLTAGLIGATLGNVQGASKVLAGGAITYNNQMKEKLLGVSQTLLKTYGAVSCQCAMAMAQGIREKTGSDLAISATGVAGPGPDETQNPQGLVYIGLCTKDKTIAKEFRFTGARAQVRRLATLQGLNLLREELEGYHLTI